ncbi:hypothetical protein Glove_122g14 [Diversispora epigaea]|uniref:Uncharacterized protein n=1 Tax=Diversispora epigaea TaxID=1348612 RepID=A0A397IZB3_9GLOM|nr:hypothetical protein Glove_122g14 [Diversispora epigaea]
MSESVQNINETTLNNKLQIFNNITQNTKSLVISDQDLTGNAGDVSAESNEAGELAKDLLSIVMIFVVRYNEIQKLQDFSKQDISLSYARGEVETQTLDGNSMMDLQSVSRSSQKRGYRCLNVANFNNTELQWILETPYDICDETINDLLKLYSSNFAAKRKKFKMKFFSRKSPSRAPLRCTTCDESVWRILSLYSTTRDMGQKSRFYTIRCSDPGVQTFITGYDPSGQAVEWGKNDISRIYQLSHIYDKIQSTHDSIHGKVHKRKRYKLRRVMLRIHKKICCLINDCHHKLAKWLCQSYRIILLPKFQTQGMVRRGKRRILSRKSPSRAPLRCTTCDESVWRILSLYSTTRDMGQKSRFYTIRCSDPGVQTFITGYDPSGQAVEWGKNDISRIYQLSHIYDKIQSTHDSIHGKVHKRKRYKLRRVMLLCESPWCRVIICTEEYTNKTSELDRDINGARNILLRYLTVTSKEPVYAGAGTYPWNLHDPCRTRIFPYWA